MFGLDSAIWLTYLQYQHDHRLPFVQIGAEPVQGNFDAYFRVAHEYLLPEALVWPLRTRPVAKAFNYSIYYLLMLAAFYVVVHSISIPWPTGLLAANLFAVLGFPGLVHLNSQTYGPFNFAPHIAQSVALSMFIVAIFEFIGSGRPRCNRQCAGHTSGSDVLALSPLAARAVKRSAGTGCNIVLQDIGYRRRSDRRERLRVLRRPRFGAWRTTRQALRYCTSRALMSTLAPVNRPAAR
jgi:hypothetical protein